ncbi:hypothetical protein GCM10020216_040820 [Nonomuraea helvata]
MRSSGASAAFRSAGGQGAGEERFDQESEDEAGGCAHAGTGSGTGGWSPARPAGSMGACGDASGQEEGPDAWGQEVGTSCWDDSGHDVGTSGGPAFRRGASGQAGVPRLSCGDASCQDDGLLPCCGPLPFCGASSGEEDGPVPPCCGMSGHKDGSVLPGGGASHEDGPDALRASHEDGAEALCGDGSGQEEAAGGRSGHDEGPDASWRAGSGREWRGGSGQESSLRGGSGHDGSWWAGRGASGHDMGTSEAGEPDASRRGASGQDGGRWGPEFSAAIAAAPPEVLSG